MWLMSQSMIQGPARGPCAPTVRGVREKRNHCHYRTRTVTYLAWTSTFSWVQQRALLTLFSSLASIFRTSEVPTPNPWFPFLSVCCFSFYSLCALTPPAEQGPLLFVLILLNVLSKPRILTCSWTSLWERNLWAVGQQWLHLGANWHWLHQA